MYFFMTTLKNYIQIIALELHGGKALWGPGRHSMSATEAWQPELEPKSTCKS